MTLDRTQPRLLLALLLALGGVACESDDHDHGGDGAGCGIQANCTGDELAPAMGDMVDGHDGVFSAMIHHVGAYAEGEGTLVTQHLMVMLRDAAGNPVSDATITVQTFSVDCGHDGPVAPAEVMADADGMYAVHSTFAHGGPWETRLMVNRGGETDMIHLSLCVPGDEHGGTHDGHMAGDGDGHDGHTDDGGMHDAGMHDGGTHDGGHMM